MKPFDFSNEKYQMGHLFLDAMRSRPDAICQIDAATGESETNASVLRRSIQLARCLRRFGTQPGDVLALGGKNHLDLNIPFYAALLNGMPISGVDPHFKYSEIKSHFKVSSPRVAFCQKEHLNDHLQVIKELDLDTKLISFDDEEYSMKKFIEQYDSNTEDDNIEPLEFDMEKIYAWLVSTGGTSGVFKLAAIKHKVFLTKVVELQKIFIRQGQAKSADNKTALQLSPVQWISSYFGTATYPLMRVTKVTTSEDPTPDHVIDIINRYKPETGNLSPFLIKAILKSEKNCDFTSFGNIVVAGSALDKESNMELRTRLRPGATITEIYGQTENLGPLLIPNPDGPIGNCGKANDNWQRMKLVDPDTGKEITEPFVNGEVWSKGAAFTEYYNNPEETAKAFTPDGWYKTGDILYKDEDENYFFVERMSMLIKCRNYHVIPTELEAIIREHPGVDDVSVTSIPQEQDGQAPVACVVRKHGCNVTAQEIKDLIASRLSESQHLHGGVVFMDELPLTSVGKLARGKLRQMVLTAQRE